MHRTHIGKRLPHVSLGILEAGKVKALPLEALVSGTRSLIVGVSGAFTPLCTTVRIPEFVQHAPALKRAGFMRLICIAPNDPWTVAAWARLVDPHGHLTFLSDGGLELARKLGVLSDNPSPFAGPRPQRYLVDLKDAVVERMAVEPALDVVTSTGAQAFMEALQSIRPDASSAPTAHQAAEIGRLSHTSVSALAKRRSAA